MLLQFFFFSSLEFSLFGFFRNKINLPNKCVYIYIHTNVYIIAEPRLKWLIRFSIYYSVMVISTILSLLCRPGTLSLAWLELRLSCCWASAGNLLVVSSTWLLSQHKHPSLCEATCSAPKAHFQTFTASDHARPKQQLSAGTPDGSHSEWQVWRRLRLFSWCMLGKLACQANPALIHTGGCQRSGLACC